MSARKKQPQADNSHNGVTAAAVVLLVLVAVGLVVVLFRERINASLRDRAGPGAEAPFQIPELPAIMGGGSKAVTDDRTTTWPAAIVPFLVAAITGWAFATRVARGSMPTKIAWVVAAVVVLVATAAIAMELLLVSTGEITGIMVGGAAAGILFLFAWRRWSGSFKGVGFLSPETPVLFDRMSPENKQGVRGLAVATKASVSETQDGGNVHPVSFKAEEARVRHINAGATVEELMEYFNKADDHIQAVEALNMWLEDNKWNVSVKRLFSKDENRLWDAMKRKTGPKKGNKRKEMIEALRMVNSGVAATTADNVSTRLTGEVKPNMREKQRAQDLIAAVDLISKEHPLMFLELSNQEKGLAGRAYVHLSLLKKQGEF